MEDVVFEPVIYGPMPDGGNLSDVANTPTEMGGSYEEQYSSGQSEAFGSQTEDKTIWSDLSKRMSDFGTDGIAYGAEKGGIAYGDQPGFFEKMLAQMEKSPYAPLAMASLLGNAISGLGSGFAAKATAEAADKRQQREIEAAKELYNMKVANRGNVGIIGTDPNTRLADALQAIKAKTGTGLLSTAQRA